MTIDCNQSCGTVVSLSVTAHRERGLLGDWGGGEHLPGGDLDRVLGGAEWKAWDLMRSNSERQEGTQLTTLNCLVLEFSL